MRALAVLIFVLLLFYISLAVLGFALDRALLASAGTFGVGVMGTTLMWMEKGR